MNDPTVKRLFNVFDKIRMNEYSDATTELEALQKAVKDVLEYPKVKQNEVIGYLETVIAVSDTIEDLATRLKIMVPTDKPADIITSKEYLELLDCFDSLKENIDAFCNSEIDKIIEKREY